MRGETPAPIKRRHQKGKTRKELPDRKAKAIRQRGKRGNCAECPKHPVCKGSRKKKRETDPTAPK